MIEQLCYKIFMGPAKCCVATCHVSTACHLLLRDPGGGRSHRLQPLLTRATRSAPKMPQTGSRVDEAARFLRLRLISQPPPSLRHHVVVSALRPDSLLQASPAGGLDSRCPWGPEPQLALAESHRKSPLRLRATPTTRTDRFLI